MNDPVCDVEGNSLLRKKVHKKEEKKLIYLFPHKTPTGPTYFYRTLPHQGTVTNGRTWNNGYLSTTPARAQDRTCTQNISFLTTLCEMP